MCAWAAPANAAALLLITGASLKNKSSEGFSKLCSFSNRKYHTHILHQWCQYQQQKERERGGRGILYLNPPLRDFSCPVDTKQCNWECYARTHRHKWTHVVVRKYELIIPKCTLRMTTRLADILWNIAFNGEIYWNCSPIHTWCVSMSNINQICILSGELRVEGNTIVQLLKPLYVVWPIMFTSSKTHQSYWKSNISWCTVFCFSSR